MGTEDLMAANEPPPAGKHSNTRQAGRPRRRTIIASLALAATTLFSVTGTSFASVALEPASQRDEPAADIQPVPPTTPEPKPKRHPRPAPPADEESPPPGVEEKISVPPSLNLFRSAGFRYQDTNYYACTATSAMVMLNVTGMAGLGGSGFRWTTSLSPSKRDEILSWERTHDTLAGGNGSDPHGWRNALNAYGWGSAALWGTSKVYEDYSFSAYSRAVKAAVRAMIRYRKPVGIVAWRGRHAQMLTGYDGILGDPFAVDAAGKYTNTFSVAALDLSDPLYASATVNRRITYVTLGSTTDTRIRFQPYYETDSPYDDPYTAGWVRARDEWYGRWVIIAPRR
jgi:hypothetical protein